MGYLPSARLVIIVGNYGSGKTEIAVNLAAALRKSGKTVHIADLDIVNPYFRCREAREMMENMGIRVVIPPGAQQYADLPIVVPEIRGMLEPQGDAVSIFDVGGDDVGATLLSSFVESLGDKPYKLLQVINSRRPFTNTLSGCVKMKESIEGASRLRVGGFIVNSHLIQETTPEVVVEGYRLAEEVSQKTGVKVEFVAVMEELANAPEIQALDAEILEIKRIMLPPWLRFGEKSDSSVEETNDVPAGRVRPIFRP